MKKLVLILLLAVSPCWGYNVLSKGCNEDKQNALTNIETTFQTCDIDVKGDSTADMLNAVYDGIHCLERVMDQLIDSFYIERKSETHRLFDDYLKQTFKIQENLYHGSDMHFVHNGTMYAMDGPLGTFNMIKTLVGDYIKEIKIECADQGPYDTIEDEDGMRQDLPKVIPTN